MYSVKGQFMNTQGYLLTLGKLWEVGIVKRTHPAFSLECPRVN